MKYFERLEEEGLDLVVIEGLLKPFEEPTNPTKEKVLEILGTLGDNSIPHSLDLRRLKGYQGFILDKMGKIRVI